MRDIGKLIPFAITVLMAAGCESLGIKDKTGASTGEVDATVAQHATNPNTHTNLNVNAAQLTAGTLDVARIPTQVTGAIAKSESDIAAHAVILNDHGTRLSAAEGDLVNVTGRVGSVEAGTVSLDGRMDAAEAALPLRVVKSGDTMTGTLQVPSLIFTSPKTKVAGISPWAFSPQNNTTTWDGYVGSGNGARIVTGGTLIMGAPVVFPDGVTLTSMSVRLYDGTPTGLLNVALKRFDGFNYTDIANIGSTAADQGGVMTVSVPLNHLVANTGEQLYWLSWTQTVAGNSGSGPALYGVRISYTYTQP